MRLGKAKLEQSVVAEKKGGLRYDPLGYLLKSRKARRCRLSKPRRENIEADRVRNE